MPKVAKKQTANPAYEKFLTKDQALINSILRDWVKGQMTAVECGILSFEAVFMPYMLTNDGRPLLDRLRESNLLPAPSDPKVVQLKK